MISNTNTKIRLNRFGIITLLIVIVIVFFYQSYSREPSKETINSFIEENHAILNLEDKGELIASSLLKKDLKDKEIFFTGEAHAVSINKNLELEWIQYFHQEAGVRYLLMETGYGSGQLFNRYLQTGDEEILKLVYRALKGTPSYNQESYNFWKKLYEYNKQLSEDQKLLVVGIDVEHQVSTAIYYLSSILPENDPAEEIKEVIDLVRKSPNYATLVRVIEDIDKNKNYYESYFGDYFFDFKMICENLVNSYKFISSNYNREIREQSIYENFLKVYDYLPKGKFYGQWGSAHIFQKIGIYKEVPFAARLQDKDSPVKDKVISIYYSYKDSKYLGTDGNVYDLNKHLYFNLGMAEEITSKDYVLLKLNGLFSPFNRLIHTVSFEEGEVSCKVSDNIQYVLFINNAEASSPLIL